MRHNDISASLAIKQDGGDMRELSSETLKPHRDTLIVQDENGNDVLIMKAVRDENGEMVASDVIDAAVVTARFRNVAERHGKVDICFQVIVPAEMQDSRWQLRFKPKMELLGDTLNLDPVIITGKEYRKGQLRGYQQYERFLSSIVTDESVFIQTSQLEAFLERNLPEIFKFKTDSSFVSDEQFTSHYGLTEQNAVDHYTNQYAVKRNRKKVQSKDRMWAKYVKVPILVDGIRLDTVIQNINGDFIYDYCQTINVIPKLRKADVLLSGAIFEQDKQIYDIPLSSPLTFYISSLSALVDNTEKYMTEIINRRVEANTACYIAFEQGSHTVLEDFSNNGSEIARIKHNLRELLKNQTFDLDSIIVTASASPEGSFKSNSNLTKKRSESVSKYFGQFIKHTKDSIDREEGWSENLDNEYAGQARTDKKIVLIPRFVSENWADLDVLINRDPDISQEDKESYFALASVHDPDQRDQMMSNTSWYKYVRESLYPRVRTVKFDFFLHRKGMIKDTVHTTVLDNNYMQGVQAIRDRDYATAVTLLRPYNDYNTAVAFCCMDYNTSAMSILSGLEKNAPVNYMMSVLYSRTGDDNKAVQCFLEACRQDASYIHRGNLDPEISSLIKRYRLNDEQYDDLYN